jgi:hypothetical protein
LVSRCSIPFARPIRSKNTSTGGAKNRPVNTLAVVGEDLLGNPVGPYRLGQPVS